MKRNQNHRRQAGFTLIELMIVIAIIGILIGAAVIGYKAATKAGYEAATLQNIRTIAAVQIQYFNTHSRSYGTFEQLSKDAGLSSKFAGNPPVADGYTYTLKLVPKTPTSMSSFTLNADPLDPSGNHFYIDSNDSNIHVNASQAAGPNDPVE
jgi:prepilin-type N-terminal cleavage/methylation domain-containing protein